MTSETLDYWIKRWENEERPSFHRSVLHPPLLALENKFWPSEKTFAILVPLCGRALELKYFLDKGYKVIGIEASEKAIRHFGQEHGIALQESEVENFGKEFRSEEGQLRIFCGDLFKFSPEMLPKDIQIGAVMDKGSAVALLPDLRQPYFQQMKRFCAYNECKYLISLCNHDMPNCQYPQVFPVEEVCVTLGQAGFRLIDYYYGGNFAGLEPGHKAFSLATTFKENGFLFSKEPPSE